MLSLVEPSGIKEHPQLYETLLQVLPSQLVSMDNGFLEVSATKIDLRDDLPTQTYS
jgi:hypothetical protein